MDINDATEELQAIADRCETDEDVRREVARLSPEEKMKIVYSTASSELFESIKYWSVWTIDFIEANGLGNNYEAGVFQREITVGMLLALARIYEQSTESMSRAELQIMSRETEYASRLATDANDLGRLLSQVVDQIITNDMNYESVLKGRQMDVHFTDEQGNHTPFTKQELAKVKAQRVDANKCKRDERMHLRAYHEMIFDGTLEPYKLANDMSDRQLVIPVWK